MTRPISFVHREARRIHACRTDPDYSRSLARVLEAILADTRVPDTFAHNAAVAYDSIPAVLDYLGDGAPDGPLNRTGYGLSYTQRAADAIRSFRERQPVVQLVAVGCSASKHDVDEPVPAQDRYAGSYWTCKERFADAVADDWRIISAKHALLAPNQAIPYYDRSVDDLAGVPVESDRERPDSEPVAEHPPAT